MFQILLEDDDIDEALNLLDQASSEGNKLDSLLFNTILQKACEGVSPMCRFSLSNEVSVRSKKQCGS